mgnify:FL=1
MKTCPGCGNPFTPENPRQRYCNETCRNTYNMRLKRQRKQARKAEIETMAARETFGGKSHLSITEAARFLGVSRPTLYARINDGELTPLKVSSRTVRIPIEQLTADSQIQPQPIKGDWSILISKAEVLQKYNISESWLMRRMKEEGFRPRIIKGKAFYPKKEVVRLFKPTPVYNKEDWYNAEDLMQSEGKTRKYIASYVREKKILVKRDGRLLLISKKDWDRSRLFQGDIEKNYLTVDQAKKHYHLGQHTFYDKVKAASIEGTRTGIYVYYKKTDLDRLFKDKTPKIPAEIRKNYMRSGDALKYYHLGQKRFSEETQAAGVTKVRTEGNYVWYKKDELDKLFKKISDNGSN